MTQVLVTGGSGFIAGHCILQLLDAGHQVRTTVRSLDREAAVRAVLAEAGMTRADALTFVAADLTDDAGWPEALDGVEYVLHVASPVRPGHVDNEDEVIRPAREGALRVLRAAREAGVRRVVLTSAFHAVGWGHSRSRGFASASEWNPPGGMGGRPPSRQSHTFTEVDWTVLDGPGTDAYGRSKTLAERAAWDFAADGGPELTTILPVAVMGPVLGDSVTGANHVVQSLLDGAMPGLPDVWIPVVDVRDVAEAHVLAMSSPQAAGERFLLSSGPAMSLRQIGALLREHLGDAAGRVPTRALPSVVLRVAALFSAQARAAVPDLGYARRVSSDKARQVLGWTARDPESAVLAAARSLIEAGLVQRSKSESERR